MACIRLILSHIYHVLQLILWIMKYIMLAINEEISMVFDVYLFAICTNK